MELQKKAFVVEERQILNSTRLSKDLTIDFFLPSDVSDPAGMSLLLINDGQNMEEVGLASILTGLYENQRIKPVLCAAIHTGTDRRQDYGVAGSADYLGRGAKAAAYSAFITEELLPYIQQHFNVPAFQTTGFAGFSLGALSALDITWNHPEIFSVAGVFSGSLWWRSLDQENPAYDDDKHRIIHQLIRQGTYRPGQRFFFQCGNMDETCDRNNNGIIDSIDDTLDLIKELTEKGYDPGKDIYYLEIADGHHDMPTWSRALPVFLEWQFGR